MSRFVGTGKDPAGRYPEGTVVDFDLGEGEDFGPLERGWVESLDPQDDLGARSEWKLADAAIRGDLQSLPTEHDDLAAARRYGLADEHGRPTPRARELVDADGVAPQASRKPAG